MPARRIALATLAVLILLLGGGIGAGGAGGSVNSGGAGTARITSLEERMCRRGGAEPPCVCGAAGSAVCCMRGAVADCGMAVFPGVPNRGARLGKGPPIDVPRRCERTLVLVSAMLGDGFMGVSGIVAGWRRWPDWNATFA